MDGGNNHGSDLPNVFEVASKKTLTIDIEHYQHMLVDLNLSEAEERQFLEALWTIICTCVDLGFGVHPAQQVCGQAKKLSDEWRKSGSDALDYEEIKDQRDEDDAPSQG